MPAGMGATCSWVGGFSDSTRSTHSSSSLVVVNVGAG